MSQATSSRCPLGFLPQVLVPAAPRINSPHSALHLGVSFLEHPAHSTPSPASYRPPTACHDGPLVSRSSAPLGTSSPLWLLSLPDPGSLVIWVSDSREKFPPFTHEYLPHSAKGIQNKPVVTIHTHPPSTCSFPGNWQHQVGAQKEKGLCEPLPSSGSTTPEIPAD